MQFKKYQHIERFGTDEVENINLGTCYVFPKLDGTNGSIWLGDDGEVKAGSRNRQLTLESDNQGFYQWILSQENIKDFFKTNPEVKLFGEWLVPHSLKTYRQDAWRRFYVFDAIIEEGESFRYVKFEEYEPWLKSLNIDYIPPLKIIRNGSYEDFIHIMKQNDYLIEDGKGAGEGIVIKNYDYINKYQRTTWAKIVGSEFKEIHRVEMGAPTTEYKMVEDEIVEKYVTQAFIDKEFAKMTSEEPWQSKRIPELFQKIFYTLVTEETWHIVKHFKHPKIDFKTLKHFTIEKVKKLKPEIF